MGPKNKIDWVHPLFWDAEELSDKFGGIEMKWGNHRFCKACWVGKEQEIPSDPLSSSSTSAS